MSAHDPVQRQHGLAAALKDLPAPEAEFIDAAAARQAILTKPAGSLGRLEEIALFMAGWQGRERPVAERLRAAIFAGNHGVAARGVSAYPAEVTAQMVANFHHGGAAINALAQACGAELTVVAIELDRPTGDICVEAAMSEADCLAAINAGAAVVEAGLDLLLLGEMGIANSTPAAALCAQAFGGPAEHWIGRGTGVDGEGLIRKAGAVERALAVHGGQCINAFETLRRLGGRDRGAGRSGVGGADAARSRDAGRVYLLRGRRAASEDNPAITDHCLAAHLSAEAGHQRLPAALALEPLLRLDMRLGEGSGAAVAAQIVRSALAAHQDMASFAEAAVASAL